MANPPTRKKPAPEDWHPADIVAALRKADWSLAQLSLEHGYTNRGSLGLALRTPYPKAEKIIADALGIEPKAIWPTRYHPDGTPNRTKGAKPLRPANLPAKGTTRNVAGNPQKRRVA